MRRILVLSCALVLLAGCGGKPWSEAVSSGGSPNARLLAAVQQTTAAHTADFSLTLEASAARTGVSVDMSGTGQIDFANRNADMTIEASAAGTDAQIEMRVVGGKIYVNEDGEWSVAQSPAAASEDGSLGGSTDPTQYLQYLEGVSPDVHVVGSIPAGGANLTTYAGTIDLHKLLASASISQTQRDQLQNELDALGSSIPSMPFSATVDDQGRLRILTITMDMSAGGETAHMDMTIRFSNFGVAVDIKPPPGFGGETQTSPTTWSASWGPSAQSVAQDRATQSDLRNALTAEKTIYTDNQTYTDDVHLLKETEDALGWGTKLHVVVGDMHSGDRQIVCLSEKSKSGSTFSIADIETGGAAAGTYFGVTQCASPITEAAIAHMSRNAWEEPSAADTNPSCAETITATVKTAIEAYRAQHGDSAARPTAADLVADGLLQSAQDFKLSYGADGTPAVTASC